MSSIRYHVIKRGKQWALKRQGDLLALKIYSTRQAAKKSAMKYQDQSFDVVIHNNDGTINEWLHAH